MICRNAVPALWPRVGPSRPRPARTISSPIQRPALTAKAVAMLAWAMMMPAIAGPMNRAELNTIELIASAEGRVGRSTRFEISAIRDGCANEFRPSSDAFVNPEAYKEYVAERERAFRKILAEQTGKVD